jgi:hypothetical protein
MEILLQASERALAAALDRMPLKLTVASDVPREKLKAIPYMRKTE